MFLLTTCTEFLLTGRGMDSVWQKGLKRVTCTVFLMALKAVETQDGTKGRAGDMHRIFLPDGTKGRLTLNKLVGTKGLVGLAQRAL